MARPDRASGPDPASLAGFGAQHPAQTAMARGQTPGHGRKGHARRPRRSVARSWLIPRSSSSSGARACGRGCTRPPPRAPLSSASWSSGRSPGREPPSTRTSRWRSRSSSSRARPSSPWTASLGGSWRESRSCSPRIAGTASATPAPGCSTPSPSSPPPRLRSSTRPSRASSTRSAASGTCAATRTARSAGLPSRLTGLGAGPRRESRSPYAETRTGRSRGSARSPTRR